MSFTKQTYIIRRRKYREDLAHGSSALGLVLALSARAKLAEWGVGPAKVLVFLTSDYDDEARDIHVSTADVIDLLLTGDYEPEVSKLLREHARHIDQEVAIQAAELERGVL